MRGRRWLSVLLTSLAILLIAASALAAPSFSPWGPAMSLESVPGASSELNTAFVDGCPMLARDGLQLYFASNRPGGLGGLDIYVAERTSADGPFREPVNVGAPINSPQNDFCPSLLRDGHTFVFASSRSGGCGGSDVYLTRHHPLDGWEQPVNLGCEVNSTADEAGPVLVFAEAGPPTLYFSSTRAGNGDLYMSQKVGEWSFGPAAAVPGVNTTYDEIQPSVSRDGRELVFYSTRPGGLGNADIWGATRESIADPWSEPFNLGPNVNSVANEFRPSLSWDGTTLFFGSTRTGVEGGFDLFYSTRQ